MFYSNYLKNKLKEETDPIRKMYLHEINLKWEKVREILDEKNVNSNMQKLTDSINEFKENLLISKYSSNKAFKKESKIFSILYLYDVVEIFVKEANFIGKKGINWGNNSFSLNISYNPFEFYSKSKSRRIIECEFSPEYLSVIQIIEINSNLKKSNKKNRFILKIPILIFDIHSIYREKNLLKFDHYSEHAKRINKYCSSIAIGEYLDNYFHPQIAKSSIDSLYILRKKYLGEKSNINEKKMKVDNLKQIRKLIHVTLKNVKLNQTHFRETGFIL